MDWKSISFFIERDKRAFSVIKKSMMKDQKKILRIEIKCSLEIAKEIVDFLGYGKVDNYKYKRVVIISRKAEMLDFLVNVNEHSVIYKPLFDMIISEYSWKLGRGSYTFDFGRCLKINKICQEKIPEN